MADPEKDIEGKIETLTSSSATTVSKKEEGSPPSSDVPATTEVSPEISENAKKKDIEASGQQPEEEYITGIRLYLVLFGTTLVAFLLMLDQTIVVTAVPRITDTFDSLKDIGWYGSAYLLTLASLQPLSGKIYQYYSSKKCFLTGLAIFEIGSLISGVARNSLTLIIGRAISGLGGSGLMTGLLTIIAAVAPLQKRPMYLGYSFGFSSMGLLFGPLLGGVLTEHASWRWCFYINLPLGAVTAIILFLIHIPDSKISADKRPTWKQAIVRLDLAGFFLFLPPSLMLLLAISWGGIDYSWKSPTIIGLFVGAAVSFVIFLFWEKSRGKDAMLPLELLGRRVVACATTTTFFSSANQYIVMWFNPVWYQVVKGVSPTTSGLWSFPSITSTIFGMVFTGALTSKLGVYTPFSILGNAIGSIGTGLLGTLVPSSPARHWAGYAVIAGIGRGMAMQQTITAVQAVLPKEELAIGNSVVMWCQTMGGTLFISFAQTMFTNQLKIELPKWAPEVNAQAVIRVGATQYKSVVSVESIKGVVAAYNESITIVFFLGAGASAAAFATSWGLGWTNIKKKKEAAVEESEGQEVKLEVEQPKQEKHEESKV